MAAPQSYGHVSHGQADRRSVILAVLASCLGLSRYVSSPRVIDLGGHLSINGWVVSRRDLHGS